MTDHEGFDVIFVMPTSIDVWESLFGSRGHRCTHAGRWDWSWCLPALPGTEKACLGLARALVRRGVSVAVVTGVRPFSWEGVEVFPCSLGSGSILRANRAASVVWVRCYNPGVVDGEWTSSRQTILWSGDSTADIAALLSRGEISVGSLTELASTVSEFDQVVLVSAWQTTDWRGSCGIRAATWIYNYTVDPGTEARETERARRPRSIIGTSHPRKSLATFCMSARAAAVAGMDLEFVTSSSPSLYGQGDLEPVFAPRGGGLVAVGPYRDVIVRYTDCIEFVGSLPTCRLYELLLSTSSFFHPDMSGETGSMALIEALKCGCTPVISSLGALPELAGEGAVVVPGEPGEPGYVAACLTALDTAVRRRSDGELDARFGGERIVADWCRLLRLDAGPGADVVDGESDRRSLR